MGLLSRQMQKALENNIPSRGLSLAPCGKGQGEGYAVVEQIFQTSVVGFYTII
jgi:hypothetical protein